MNNTFELKKGKLVFEWDRIIITDNARVRRRIILYLLGATIILGIVFGIGHFIKGEQYDTWLGFFTGLALCLALAATSYRSVQSEIYLHEVKSMKIKRSFSNDYLEIKLKNNINRMVVGIVNSNGLREFIETVSLPK
jgi:uncharacterized membrane protein